MRISWLVITAVGASAVAGGCALAARDGDGTASIEDPRSSGAAITTTAASRVVVAGAGVVYATDPASGTLWEYADSSPGWTQIGGPTAKIAATRGALYALSPDRSAVWQLGGAPMEWNLIGGPTTDLVAGGRGLFGVSPNDGSIWQWAGAPMSWSHVGSAGSEFAVNDVALYGVSPDHSGVWQYDGGWTQVGGPFQHVYAARKSLFATSATNGNLYQYQGTPMVWAQVGGPGAEFAANDAAIYGLSPDRSGVWRYADGGWTQVGGPAVDIFASGTSLYATSPANGDVWKYTGTPMVWTDLGVPKLGSGASGPPSIKTLVGDPSFELQKSATVGAPWEADSTATVENGTGTAMDGGIEDVLLRGDSGWHVVQQWVTVKPFTHYTATAAVQTSGAISDAYFSARSSATWRVLDQAHFGALGAGWQTVRFELDSGSDTKVLLYAGYWGRAAGSWMRVDDVALTEDANLVANGSFESGAASWSTSGSIESIAPHGGAQAMLLQGTSGWSSTNQWVTVARDTAYHATAWIRTTTNVADGYFSVRGNSSQTTFDVINQAHFGALGDWSLVSFDFNSGANTSVLLYAGFWGPGAAASIEVDDVALTKANDAASEPADTFYLSEPILGSSATYPRPPSDRATLTLTYDPVRATYAGTIAYENDPPTVTWRVDSVTWTPATRLLQFRVVRAGTRWFRMRLTRGVLTGRVARLTASGAPAPSDLTAYAWHATGWSDRADGGDIVPRVFKINDGTRLATLRIDRGPSGFFGRYKVYADTAAPGGPFYGEQLEADVAVPSWDGTNLTVTEPTSSGTRVFQAVVRGRKLTGTRREPGSTTTAAIVGERAEVLSYGLATRTPSDREAWQTRTRQQLHQLMMGGNPTDGVVTTVATTSYDVPYGFERLEPPPPECPDYSCVTPVSPWRDDGATGAPSDRIESLEIDSTIPSPYGGPAMTRHVEGFLAQPAANAPVPPGGFPIAIALNGHGGRARYMLEWGNGVYWFGDGFARKNYVTLSIDIGHRPPGERYGVYPDDHFGTAEWPPQPPIASGALDSDFEQDGERIWDVMRGLDYVLAHVPNVNRSRIVVAGLSQGAKEALLLGALDPRVRMAIPAGWEADNEMDDLDPPCSQWAWGDRTEYVGASDDMALIAPRPLLLETGERDGAYSKRSPSFSSDLATVRRVRAYYADAPANLIEYLKPSAHCFNTGAAPLGPHAGPSPECYPDNVAASWVPGITVPAPKDPATWQTSSDVVNTHLSVFDEFDRLVP